MSSRYFRLPSWLVLCFGIASVLFFSYKASAGQHVLTPIIVWALAPYLVALIAAFFPQSHSGTLGVLLGCVLFVFGSAWAYYDAFFVHTDAQNALVFVFFPAVQLVSSVLLVVFAGIASAASARRNNIRAA